MDRIFVAQLSSEKGTSRWQEYPGGGGLPSNDVRPEDEQNYTLLLQELTLD